MTMSNYFFVGGSQGKLEFQGVKCRKGREGGEILKI